MKNQRRARGISIIAICFFTFFYTSHSFAQNPTLGGIEFQAYPTGIIAGVAADFPISSKGYIHSKVGVNIFDHRDLGEQDQEEGNGYGFTLGYRQFFKEGLTGWRWGIKNDLWLNSVDWENTDEQGNETSGETDITVLQPTAELSYVFSNGNLVFAPSIAFGMEWNIKTEGEPTGEGPIILLGFQLSKAF